MSKYAMYRRRGRGEATTDGGTPAPIVEVDFTAFADGLDVTTGGLGTCVKPFLIYQKRIHGSGDPYTDLGDTACDGTNVQFTGVSGVSYDVRAAWSDDEATPASPWSEPEVVVVA